MNTISSALPPEKPQTPPVRKVKIKIGARSFTVHFDADEVPIRVYERKMYAPGTNFACWYDAPYWHARHHKSPKRKHSLIARILAAAAEK